MNEQTGSLDASIQEKLEADTEFQSSLKDLAEDAKVPLIEAKKKELLENEFKTLSEKAEKATKSDELANNYKVRADKAEQALKKYEKTETKTPDGQNFTVKDHMALVEAKVPQDDLDDVVDYAKFKGISIAEALKSSVVKTTLAEKAEFRRTAAATAVKTTRPTQNKIDGDKVMEDINTKGEDGVPEKGSAEAEALFWKRRNKKNPDQQ